MQMAMVISIRNLLIHNKLGDERNIVISRVGGLIKPSSMKYALFPVSFLHPPHSVYLVMPLNSTNYGLALGLICTTDTQRKTELHVSIEKCQLLWHTQVAEHCTPTSHMKQGGRLPGSHW